MKILTLMTFIFLSFSSVSFADSDMGESQKAECKYIHQDSRDYGSAQDENVEDEKGDSSKR